VFVLLSLVNDQIVRYLVEGQLSVDALNAGEE
jgi:hypothetical protein